jgi:putative restriction endonuclease
METPGELAIRMKIFDALARVVAEQSVVTRDQVGAFPVGDTTRRLIDQSRGIWNPRDLAASLTVASAGNG